MKITVGRPHIILFFLIATAVQATNLYVSARGGTGIPPYTNWAMAPSNIQTVVNWAAADDAVWISNGVYVLTSSISITKGIAVIATNGVVVIDGNYSNTTNRCVYMDSAAAVIDGLTISNGYSTDKGGGIYVVNGAARNCMIQNNTALTNGGGVYLANNSRLENSIVMQNTSLSNGAGISAEQGVITNCLVVSNRASGLGGGVIFNSSGIMVSSTDSYNSALEGGGIYFANGLASNCLIYGNTATNGGGGFKIWINGSLANCIIENNTSSQHGGGGYSIGNGSPIAYVRNCIIRNNSAVLNGGGMEMSGAIQMDHCIIVSNWCNNYGGGIAFDFAGTYIRNSLVYGNSAPRGGGVYLRMAGSIQNCTIASNTALTGVGGGVYCISGSLGAGTGSVQNTIIYFNTAPGNPASSNYYSAASGGNAFFTNCCMAPATNSGVLGAARCIEVNPNFSDKDQCDYHLSVSSPCINAGTNQDWMTNSVDLDGRIRIRYGTVDMGAYELIYNGTIYTIP